MSLMNAMRYLLNAATRKRTPQSEPIPGREKDMERNNAVGFGFKSDAWTRLERFLILGSERGSYYVSESELTRVNVDNLQACIQADGVTAVDTIVAISTSGRAPRNEPALYALAAAASSPAPAIRAAALAALPKIARTGTQLFSFCQFIDGMRGWGPSLRKAVAAWYLEKPEDSLAYQLVKYQNRNGWAHRDVLRLIHLRGGNSAVLRWVTGAPMGERDINSKSRKSRYPAATGELPALVQAYEEAQHSDVKTVIQLIRQRGLTREMIPTKLQKSPAVWEALLERMPLTAMIRTLGRMGAVGLLAPLSDTARTVCSRLADRNAMRKARVHPIQCLSALLTYKNGHGYKGNLSWTPVPQVVDALDAAFYESFENVESTGKRFYLGVDVSASMTMGRIAGLEGLTPNMGAAAMAMLIARKEPNYFIGGFATTFVDLGISPQDRLDAAMAKCQRSFGGTDCAIPIESARSQRIPVDAFVVITDGETWAGDRHASQSLEDYRNKMGIDSKLIVINMVANRTRLTDPTDAGSLDVVGFDASVPAVINGFLGAGQQKMAEEEAE